MVSRSLQASSVGLEEANNAFINTGLTQEDFAKKLEMARSTVCSFFAGKSIDRPNFFKICKELNLKPNEIFEPITNCEKEEVAKLKQWILNEYCQLVAFLDMPEETYIVARINKELREAVKIEILKCISLNVLKLNQSISLEELFSYLNKSTDQDRMLHSLDTTKTLVNLTNWFQNKFEVGWQSVENFLSERKPNLALNFRGICKVDNPETNYVKRVKLIDLGTKLSSHPIALVVALMPGRDNKLNIRLQVHPIDSQSYLPLGLQLVVLDECGKLFIEAKARQYDNWIQLELSGLAGELFSVKLALDNFVITEGFVI